VKNTGCLAIKENPGNRQRICMAGKEVLYLGESGVSGYERKSDSELKWIPGKQTDTGFNFPAVENFSDHNKQNFYIHLFRLYAAIMPSLLSPATGLPRSVSGEPCSRHVQYR
jgi:hypothetical protein